MALGEILKNARVKKGLSFSDVAENTHMLVQIVEALEREDFRRIAAPIYGRGFVKLYAECLDLDPEPLIRDFMTLYDGARMPTLRPIKAEQPIAERPKPEPTTRTVTGAGAGLMPERDIIQCRPAIRSLTAAEAPSKNLDQGQKGIISEEQVNNAEMVASTVEESVEVNDARVNFVVEPETAYDEDVEPDLFRPRPQRKSKSAENSSARSTSSKTERSGGRKFKLPIFKIGRGLDSKPDSEPLVQDEATHARHCARVASFMAGVAKLKGGLECRLPHALPSKQNCLLGGAAVAAVLMMVFGVRALFKMTDNTAPKTATPLVKQVAPPPDLYVD